MKLILLIALFVLSSTAALAADLEDYPDQFITNNRFEAQIVVGSNGAATDVLAATEIAVRIRQDVVNDVTAIFDYEFNDAQDAILIGLPCKNEAMADILETDSCSIGLDDDEGFIKLIEGDATYLIVTGSDDAATRKAGRLLAEYDTYNLQGTEMRIGGTLDDPEEFKAPELEIEEPECTQSNDCSETEVCQDSKCVEIECAPGDVIINRTCSQPEEDLPEPELINEPEPPKPPTPPTEEVPTPIVEEEQVEEDDGFFQTIISFFRNLF